MWLVIVHHCISNVLGKPLVALPPSLSPSSPSSSSSSSSCQPCIQLEVRGTVYETSTERYQRSYTHALPVVVHNVACHSNCH